MNKLKKYFSKYTQASDLSIFGPMSTPIQKQVDPVIYVDGGVIHKTDANIGVSVGDGDSGDPSQLDILLPNHKDYSDLEFVLNSVPRHFTCLKFFGFMGGRQDHEIINLSTIYKFLISRKETQAMLENGLSIYSHGKWRLELIGEFSILSLLKNRVSLSGECEYKIENLADFGELSSRGLSNIGFGEVQLECEQPILLFLSTLA